MLFRISLFILIAAPTLILAQEEKFIQDLTKKSQFQYKIRPQKIGLNEVIEQGLRENFEQHIREFENAEVEIDLKDASSEFWMPKLKLELITSPQKLATLKSGSKKDNPTSKSPTGSFGLKFDDYILFNWGKDFLKFQNVKTTLERTKDSLDEQRRELKQELIIAYFRLYTIKEIQKIYREQLQKAAFVYRLNREKVMLKKINKENYYQSRAEYFRAQSEYHEAKKNSEVIDEELSKLLNDKPGVRYLPEDLLAFKELSMPIKEAVKLAEKNNPEILDSRAQLKVAQRDYEIQLKENLPLPKISVGLGTWASTFSGGSATTGYETGPGNSNIEVVATINATWPLTGQGGIFNTRTSRKKLIAAKKAQKEVDKFTHYSLAQIREYYKRIISLEEQMKLLEERSKNVEKTLDIVLDNYLLRKSRFAEFSNTLKEFRDSKIRYLSAIFTHLELKVKLSKTVGIENFPGESFETLAKKRDIQ